jgi:argininosuccinate lyase
MTEFKFVDLADRYCSTSSIMPQKKNSWALAWVRGQASLAIGRLSGVFTLLKGESDALEDTLLGPWQLYETLDELQDMAEMLAGIVSSMTVDTRRLAATASHGWTQATDLAAMLTQEARISWREAHQTVAHLVRESIAAGRQPEDLRSADLDAVAERLLGRPLRVRQEAIDAALDPHQALDSRAALEGSPAPGQVTAQIAAGQVALADDEMAVDAQATHLREAAARLEAAVDAVLAQA